LIVSYLTDKNEDYLIMCQLMNKDVFKLLTGLLLVIGLLISDVVLSQTVWDISTNIGYNNDITGIGRDDCGGLDQRQSISVESDAIVTVGRGGISSTNAGNPNAISSDLSFFIWGNNNAAAQSNWSMNSVSISGSECEYLMINRIWRGVETNDVGSILLRMEADNVNYDIPDLPTGNDGSYYLLKDDDGNFTNGGTTALQMFNLSGSEWTVSAGDAEDMFFTFAAKLNNPFEVTIEDASGNLSVTDDESNLGAIDLYATMPFALDHDVSIDFASANGSATTADSDYSAGSGTATITAGNTSILINDVVTVIDNNIGESDESFTVALSNPSGVCLGSDDTYTINIDNDDAPTLTINDITVNENVGTATLTVTASNASSGNIVFDVSTSNNTATAGQDYTPIPGSTTATIIAGATTVDIDVPITNDLIDETSENFNVIISSATTPGGVTITDGTGVITITDNDSPPEICIDAVTSVTEGTANANISIFIDAVSGQDIAVTYTTSDGTAFAGSDYIAQSNTVTIPAGSTSTSFDVPIIDDSSDEVDQTFGVTLSNPSNATIGSGCSNCLTNIFLDPGLWSVHAVTSQETVVSGQDATFAFDGDPNTYWSTQYSGGIDSYPHEIEIDLGVSHDFVNGFRYQGRVDALATRIANYEIFTSTDGISYGAPVASGTWVDVSTPQDVSFGGVTAQFIKLRATSAIDGGSLAGAAEISISKCSNNTTTIIDNDAPPALCKNISVALDATGTATITESQVDNGSNLNGTIASYDTDVTSFDCDDVGTVTVTLTVTDNTGQTNSCTADVTVQDTTSPSISCVGNQSVFATSGLCTAVVNGIAPTSSSDNCSGTSITYNITGATTASGSNNASGTAFNVGVSTVTYTITDASLNTDFCSFTVTVTDNQNPTISCVANIAQNTDPGDCTAVVNGIAPSASGDNCPGATITYSITGVTTGTGSNDASGATFNIGTSTVTYTITDASSNSSQCSFDVVISDNEAPSISCVGNQSRNTDSGNCTAVVNGIAPTASSDLFR